MMTIQTLIEGICVFYDQEIYPKMDNNKITLLSPYSNGNSTDWRRGLALGLTQILGLASGVWRRETQIFTF